MINTPEFWVGIAFLMCMGIAVKIIFPKLNIFIEAHQRSVENVFLDAEGVLLSAQKKISAAQKALDELPQLMSELEANFEAKINVQLTEWQAQQEKIFKKHKQIEEYTLHGLAIHLKSKMYYAIIVGSMNVLQIYLTRHMNAVVHQKIVQKSLELLRTFKI